MPEYAFETHAAVDLLVEFGSGQLTAQCTDTTESFVRVEGRGADDVVVEQRDHEIRVVEPRRGGFGRDSSLRIDIVVPTGSHPTVRTGSADIEVRGSAGTGELRSGSGDVYLEYAEGDLRVETGSGDIRVDRAGEELRVKTGSGDLSLGEVGGPTTVSTGSGDIAADRLVGAAVLKTGSGDMHVREAADDLSASTGSGDVVVDRVHRGRLTAKGASGSVRVGVASGVPVWTDLTTVTGHIHSSLQGAGQPEEGQDHVELRVQTVTGDIELAEV